MGRKLDPRYAGTGRRREYTREWLHDHTEALAVECPGCGAKPEQPCLNPITGRPTGATAHWQRIRVARVAVPAQRAAEPA